MGDYSVVAKVLEPASVALLDACAVTTGTKLLDVGTGSGNLAIEAARRGAAVTGSDLTPELLRRAQERAEAEGLSIDWREADAENLPFEDGTFDVVTSVFGAIFAPRAANAAAEMMRVTRHGGIVGMTAWAKDGYNGATFALSSRFMPPPPEGVDTPVSWGDEASARARFEAAGAEVEIRRASVVWPATKEHSDLLKNNAPNMVAAKTFLPPETFDEMMRGLEAIQADYSHGTDQIASDYLLILARKRS